MTVVIEEPPNEKPTKKPATPTRAPARAMLDAERFAGQPLVLKVRLERALEELFFYRVSGRHHTEAETVEARSHARWKREAVDLARSLADAIVAGELEPVHVRKPEEDE